MPIVYCGLFSRQGQIVLAESTYTKSYSSRIGSLINSMYKKENTSPIGSIEIEDNEMVTYCRTKFLVFVCISPKDDDGEAKSKQFLQERLIPGIMNEFNRDTDSIVNPSKKGDALTTLIHQSRLSKLLNTEVANTDTGIRKNPKIKQLDESLNMIKSDLKETIGKQLQDNDNLESLLQTSEKISKEAVEYKENAKELEYQTRCIKPWMIITSVIIVVLIIVYIVFSLLRCGDLNIFCKNPKYTIEDIFMENLRKAYPQIYN